MLDEHDAQMRQDTGDDVSLVIDFSGMVIAITGGGRGVGRGIAAAFLEAGADVELCGRSQPEQLPTVGGRTAVFRSVDVRDPDRVDGWIQDILERHGRLDVLVNNVGGSPFGRFEAGSPRYLTAITELNFLSAAFTSRAAYDALRAAQGSVVNITSISARRPSPGTAVYGAAKAALESLSASLAVEWAPDVRVNAISCGLVATEGAVDHYGSPEQYAQIARTIPRGQLATPEEVGRVCVMLASPLAAHVTGAVLAVDGGGEWPAFLSHTPHADMVMRADRTDTSRGAPS
ncbi:SDR family oxidoreductase [Microbacterium sp. zg.Y1090]|uniref:SDR family oxidoreductase n=1 Tax=Microbacterium TaxID=33882 RepID=UPI00214C1B8D|nr:MULTISPECIES: SDR family oxidoreductase [unclassified Microbacterium]MCR2813318.1 SDR family oxidoreductase [Microbacterium sp. zg.Y1084]MCR2819848.1 SDR family oxidoreductase [Microbacterium sp. zg.Y1090]MDL5487959.1 SDR family oxidoreductase [Microbacterium sp. zg-Y1211]WIM28595.1 SDR family oxidoreductase [Microbacterium sp. zg-Y1090]